MERARKEELVAELKELFTTASSCVVVDFSGVTMETFTPMRKEFALNKVRMLVAKNTLAKIAVKGTAYEPLIDSFKGMSSLVFTLDNDQVVGAKILKKFADKDDNIEIKCGVVDGKLLSKQDVEVLSKLPGKEELQATLLATMLAVPQNFVRLLNAVPQNFVQLLNAYREKIEG